MKTVKIGKQEQMAENLNVSTFRNGDPIPEAKSDKKWRKAGDKGRLAWCYYKNKKKNGTQYGKLYNWYAVNDPRGLAPEGWHIPSDAECKTLEMYLGMSQSEADDIQSRGTDEGGKLKEAGTTRWDSPNSGATNESGFSALPGGCRLLSGSYVDMGEEANLWSFTEYSRVFTWFQRLHYDISEVRLCDNGDKELGFSVRCVRD